MTDTVEIDLRTHVERTLASVAVRPSHRRRIQEEMLAHLLAVYDEEFARTGDENASARTAKGRFGCPEVLGSELEASVPLVERLFFLFLLRKANIMWRWLLLLGLVAVAVGLGFVMPAVAQLRQQPGPIAVSGALLVLGTVLALAGVGSFACGIVGYRRRKLS
jgi:hypothetical protein